MLDLRDRMADAEQRRIDAVEELRCARKLIQMFGHDPRRDAGCLAAEEALRAANAECETIRREIEADARVRAFVRSHRRGRRIENE